MLHTTSNITSNLFSQNLHTNITQENFIWGGKGYNIPVSNPDNAGTQLKMILSGL